MDVLQSPAAVGAEFACGCLLIGGGYLWALQRYRLQGLRWWLSAMATLVLIGPVAILLLRDYLFRLGIEDPGEREKAFDIYLCVLVVIALVILRKHLQRSTEIRNERAKKR